MKIAVCDDDPKAVGIFGRYAAAVIEYAFTYEFYQNPEEMLYLVLSALCWWLLKIKKVADFLLG